MRTRRSRRNRRRTNRRGGNGTLSNFGANVYYAANSALKGMGLKETRKSQYNKDLADAGKIDQLKRDLLAGKNDDDFRMFKATKGYETLAPDIAVSRYIVHLKLMGNI